MGESCQSHLDEVTYYNCLLYRKHDSIPINDSVLFFPANGYICPISYEAFTFKLDLHVSLLKD